MIVENYSRNGFCIEVDALSSTQVNELRILTEPLLNEKKPYGIRNLFREIPEIERIAKNGVLVTLASTILGDNVFPVKAIFFDKVPDANWNVAWHQDTTIAVAEKHEIDGYGPWSEKEGVTYVEPPLSILENMVTLRVHLDLTSTDNGALRVVPGSHKKGRISSADLLAVVDKSTVVDCEACPGDILIMSPLLLHSSRKSLNPSHRRIIHVEYCARELDAPLEWKEKVA